MRAAPTLEETTRLSRERLRPSMRNSSWLVLRQRRRIFEERIRQLPSSGLKVLDVGGRLQPYRPLLGGRVQDYLTIDPDITPLVNAAAVAEYLPFRDGQFDLVICTQVMQYFPEPARAVEEMRRVLCKGGFAFVSAPSVFVRDHEREYWRFLRPALLHLFEQFDTVEVIAEGNSASGMVRTVNVFLTSFIRPRFLLPICEWSVVPLLNMAGLLLEKMGRNNEDFAANFSVWARK